MKMASHWFRRGLSVGVAWVLALSAAQATTYYVATNGSNTDNGLSPGYTGGNTGPFATLQKAVAVAVAGDTIALRVGTYATGVYITGDYAAAPLTITRHQQESVTIQTQVSNAFVLQNAKNVQVVGLRFTAQNVNISPLYLNAVEKITVSNCTFASVSGGIAGAAYVDIGRDLKFVDNRFESNAIWSLNFNRAQSSLVEGNVFEQNRALVTMYWSGGADSRNNRISRNRFNTNYQPGGADNLVLWLNRIGTNNVVSENFIGNAFLPTQAMTGLNSSAIRVTSTDGIDISGNVISNYQFRGKVDLTYGGPQYVITAAEGGRTGHGVMLHSDNPGGERVEGARIVNNLVFGSGNMGLNLLHVNDAIIQGNGIISNGHYGIHLGGEHNGTVTGNIIEANDVAENGWLNGGMAGISLTGCGRGNIVRRNQCYRNRQGTAGKKGYDWFGDGEGIIIDVDSHGSYVLSNICHDNEGCGLVLIHANNCTVMNNTFVGNGSCPHLVDFPGISILAEWQASSGHTIVNNIIYNNRARQIDVWDLTNQQIHHNVMANGPLTEAAAAANDIVAYLDDGSLTMPFLTLVEWKSYWAGLGNSSGTADIGANPQLAGGTGPWLPDHFKLKSTSPCINAGVSAPGLSAEKDFLGNPRVAGANPDMGAIEYGSVGLWSSAVDLGGGWKWSTWFGYFQTDQEPWIFHQEHGWLYEFGSDTASVVFWDASMSAFWWTSKTQYPYVYRFSDGAWLWYLKGSTSPRWFQNLKTGTWEQR